MRKFLLIKSIFLVIYFFQFNYIYTGNIQTSWTDPITNYYYDWSFLKRNRNYPYIINDKELDVENFSLKYYFNIGDFQNQKCNNKSSLVTEILEYNGKNTGICEIIGRESSINVNLLDYNNPNLGIVLEYGDGEICINSEKQELIGLPRKARFKIYCSKNKKDIFVLDFPGRKQGITKCILEFKIYSPAGCPKLFLFRFKSSIILLFIIVTLFLYIILGYSYNMILYNLKGKSAIPNYIFWRQFPWLVIEGIKLIIEINKRQINKVYKFFNNLS